MNRIDNTHATFLSCLRDWNDPFLHGHKTIKSYGCQRCETCACRSVHSSTNSLNRESCPNRVHTHSKLSKKLVKHDFLTGFQPIIRCRSSANVPNTINQCIKHAKPRLAPLKPHSSRKKTNNSKISNNSIESDKESSDNVSKDEEFKILFQSSPDVSLTSKGTSEFVQNNEMLPKSNMEKSERDEILVESLRKTKDHDLSIEKLEQQCLDNESNENKIKLDNRNGDNLIIVLSSSTSSSIEDIVYDDSLQGESFESDSLMLDIDKKQLEKKDDRSELKETSSCQFKSTFAIDQDSKSQMDLINLNIGETTFDEGCKNQSRLNSVQQGYREIGSNRRVSLNDSIEEEGNLLKKPSPNRSYSEGYLNDNDTDIDQDFDCSNSDLSTNRGSHNLDMDGTGRLRSSSFDRARIKRQSPIHQLEDQMQFYERIKDTFLANLDKQASLTPQSSSPKRRRSTSSEQKFLHSDKLVYKVCGDGDKLVNELTLSSRSSSRSSSFSKNLIDTETKMVQDNALMTQAVSVPAIVVHDSKLENEKSIENCGCHGNQSENIDKSMQIDSFQAEQTSKQQHSSKLSDQQVANASDKLKRTKLCSFLTSPGKKRTKMDEQQPSSSTAHTDSIDSQHLRLMLEQELKTDQEDEFFVAISSHSLHTGSCPEFYWYPGTQMPNKRARSENDLITPKSYENITQSNYVQMINSMIHGAISDMTDPDYADYLKRHIQGLFDNLTPVLMKSKSNEEMAIASPSRDKISDMINQSMPKSLSFDFKLLEESKLNHSEDVMDFSKFGLGIKDHESSDESLESDQLERSYVDSHETEIEELINQLIDQLESQDNFEPSELKSSTRINFDDCHNDTKLNASIQQSSLNDDSTPFGSESCASTIVNVTLKKEPQNQTVGTRAEPNDENVNLVNSSDSDEDYSETRRLIPNDSDDSEDNGDGRDDQKRSNESNGLSDSLEDDVIIECKVDYRIRSGSDSSSDSSLSDSDESEKKSSSDYDNMKQNVSASADEPETVMLSTSVHSLNSVDSGHNLVNETLASLTSLNSEQKSMDDEDEPEFIFGDDLADLDENWMQEDDWFASSAIKPGGSIHSIRQLDPIAEEDERAKDEDMLVFKKSQDLKDLFDHVDKFKISFEYKYRPESEKLRSQDCSIRSLLGSSAPAVTKDESTDEAESSFEHDTNKTLSDRLEEKTATTDLLCSAVYTSNDGACGEETKESDEASVPHETLTESYEEVNKESQIKIEIRHSVNDESMTSEPSVNSESKDRSLNETLTECFEQKERDTHLQVEIRHGERDNGGLGVDDSGLDKAKSCSSIETSSEKCDELQKDSVLETRYFETSESDSSFKTDARLSQKCYDVQKDSLLELETQYTGNADDTSSEGGSLKAENFDDLTHKYEEIDRASCLKFEAKYAESDSNEDRLALSESSPVQDRSELETSSSECQSNGHVSDEEEIHVEYFEYVITNDVMDRVDTGTEKKSESELDLSKLHLSLRDEESNASSRLKEVLCDIEKEIEIRSALGDKCADKSYQVCPGELAVNMVDGQTQSTPPLSPLKRLAPLKKNAYTETDDSEIFSQYLISTEEQKLRQKLKEKENSLKQTTIATQTESDTDANIECLPAKENQRSGDSNVRKIVIVNEDRPTSDDTSLKLNVRQKIKIQNLDEFAKPADNLVKEMAELYSTPVRTTHFKSVDMQTEEEERKEPRTRSVSNSSTFIDMLSLNLDRSKTWVELTEAKLNYMIGETDAVLRSMNLDSSDEETKSNSRNLSINTQESLTPRKNLNSSRSYTSPRVQLISPEHTLNCLTSTTRTIEEMTQVYLDNYKRQLEDSRKELSTKMSMLEAEKDKIAKIRDSRKKELYMRRQAAIQAFKLERERELRSSFNEDMANSHTESFVYDDFDDDEFSRTLRTSKRLINDLPSQNREKLAKLRRGVVQSSSGTLDDESYVAPRPHVDKASKKSYKNKSSDSRLVIPVHKTYIEETTETRIEHTTSSSSNSSSIIDESRLLLKEYEQLRNDSVSEIQRAQDSLNASLLWLENQKQNRMRSFKENKPSKDMYHASFSKSRTESGRSSRADSVNSNKSTKTRELSPVSRFREEQKEYLLKINTNNSPASNPNSNRKEIPISIYSPLSSSSFLSSPSSNYTSKRNPTSSNHKARVDQVSKSNTTKITITDYTTKIPSNQPSYQRVGIPPSIPSHQHLKNKYRYISQKSSDSDEDKIC